MGIKAGIVYINQIFFSRAFVAHHKILISLKGHFSIYKRKSSITTALQFQIIWTILDAADFLCPPNSGCRQNLHG